MNIVYEDKEFTDSCFLESLTHDSFDNCTFVHIDFSSAKILSSSFTDCIFSGCNLSMAEMTLTTLNNVSFVNCKILGVKFNTCNDFIFDVAFENCILDYCSFSKRKMPKTVFKDSSLKSVDFGDANLKGVKFINTDLNEAIFYNTNIQGADFTSAYNYIIDLTQNQVKKARFSKDGLSGLLNQFNIIIE